MPRKKPFNNPFEPLKLDRPDPPEKPAPAAPAPPAPPPADARRPLSDEDLWALAVEGAAPLEDRSARIKPDPEPIATAYGPLDPELAAYDELRALVNGAAPFDIADSDEFIEGSARGLDHHVLRRLRRGDFAVQGHVDLHGLTQDQMPVLKDALKRWMKTARFSDHVLAFATARPHDGGLGAVYVLLRRL